MPKNIAMKEKLWNLGIYKRENLNLESNLHGMSVKNSLLICYPVKSHYPLLVAYWRVYFLGFCIAIKPVA